MDQVLDNPVYYALKSRDRELGSGNDRVVYFDEEVSPFVGIRGDLKQGFDELWNLLQPGRTILFAIRQPIAAPAGWQVVHEIAGLQFIFDSRALSTDLQLKPTPLEVKHVDEMIALAKLTKPGPFSRRTIEFGHYHGFFAGGRLVAMTGQRLHPNDFSEISAVCTHPDHLGKGYAATLIQQQLNIISRTNATPFLHVRADNARAIRIYERLGFRENGPMYFYFMKRKA